MRWTEERKGKERKKKEKKRKRKHYSILHFAFSGEDELEQGGRRKETFDPCAWMSRHEKAPSIQVPFYRLCTLSQFNLEA